MSDKMPPRQKNLVALLPEVEAGKMTMREAMKQAGYTNERANR